MSNLCIGIAAEFVIGYIVGAWTYCQLLASCLTWYKSFCTHWTAHRQSGTERSCPFCNSLSVSFIPSLPCFFVLWLVFTWKWNSGYFHDKTETQPKNNKWGKPGNQNWFKEQEQGSLGTRLGTILLLSPSKWTIQRRSPTHIVASNSPWWIPTS